MSDQLYSPSVAAALASRPKLAQVARVKTNERRLPHPTSDEARELLYLDPFNDLPPPPRPLKIAPQPTPEPMYGELHAALIDLAHEEDIADRARVSASALWAGSLRPETTSDAIDNALLRIDKLEERAKRYRMATGREMVRRKAEHERAWPNLSFRISPELVERMNRLGANRAEKLSQVVRFLLECGLILADERARRYELWVMNNLRATALQEAQIRAESPEELPQKIAEVMVELEPERYLDTKRDGFAHTLKVADPLRGAPPTIRELLEPSSAPRSLSA